MKPYRARSNARLIAFVAVLTIALIAIVARLAQVQLVQGETFASAARANQIQLIPISAPRGLIVDRNGVVMVRSRPSFVCALIPSEVVHIDDTLHQLAAVLHIDEAKLRHRLYHHLGVNYENFDQVQTYEPNGPVILASDLTPAQTAQLAESESSIAGVDLEEQPVRNYPMGTTGAQVFGYVGAITEDEYRARKNEGYSPNDVVGKDGLEQTYDTWLRGRLGGQQIEVNSSGVLVRRLKPVDPIPGNTLVTTIDALQRIVDKDLRAELALRGKALGHRVAGAAVVLDPNTGGVLALASYPTYDPNDFATPISARKFAHYIDDPLQPLYNRAIGAASPTGSTFKMVTGSGAISAGVIGKDQILYDSGSWNCHGVVFSDIVSGGLGTTDFVKALAASSDGYFYQLGYRLGHERLRYYRSLDPSHLRQGLSPRAERRLPAGHRAGCDASDPAADRQRARDRAQRRHALPAAHRRGRAQPARQGAQDVRPRGHPPGQRDLRGAARGQGGDGSGHEPDRDRLRARDPRHSAGRQERHRRDRGRGQRQKHDLVRHVRSGAAPQDRDGGVRGKERRLRRQHLRDRGAAHRGRLLRGQNFANWPMTGNFCGHGEHWPFP